MSHGWVQVGEFYDDIDDPVFPKDPAVVAAMQRRWPDLFPFRHHSVWMTPAGTILNYWFYGVGRVVDNPKTDLTLCGFLRRTTATGHPPNLLERIFEGERGKDGKPGEFKPFNWDRYYELVRDDLYADPNMTAKDAVKQMLQARVEELEKARQAVATEIQERGREEWPFIKKMLERISDVEWAERARAARAGELGRHRARPFVELRAQ